MGGRTVTTAAEGDARQPLDGFEDDNEPPSQQRPLIQIGPMRACDPAISFLRAGYSFSTKRTSRIAVISGAKAETRRNSTIAEMPTSHLPQPANSAPKAPSPAPALQSPADAEASQSAPIHPRCPRGSCGRGRRRRRGGLGSGLRSGEKTGRRSGGPCRGSANNRWLPPRLARPVRWVGALLQPLKPRLQEL